jgi:hypothetical protein
MTYTHPITLQQLAADREARLRHQANVRRRIERIRRRIANCA